MVKIKIERGDVRKVKGVWVLLCGECGRETPYCHIDDNSSIAARKLKWKYTRESGWVCASCKVHPRLPHDAPNRPIGD